jgi:hypothetical protein
MATTTPSMRPAGFRLVSPRFQRLRRVELDGAAMERSAGQRDPDRPLLDRHSTGPPRRFTDRGSVRRALLEEVSKVVQVLTAAPRLDMQRNPSRQPFVQRPGRPGALDYVKESGFGVASSLSGFCTQACLRRIPPATCANDTPLETATHRSVPMGCKPNVDHPRDAHRSGRGGSVGAQPLSNRSSSGLLSAGSTSEPGTLTCHCLFRRPTSISKTQSTRRSSPVSLLLRPTWPSTWRTFPHW